MLGLLVNLQVERNKLSIGICLALVIFLCGHCFHPKCQRIYWFSHRTIDCSYCVFSIESLWVMSESAHSWQSMSWGHQTWHTAKVRRNSNASSHVVSDTDWGHSWSKSSSLATWATSNWFFVVPRVEASSPKEVVRVEVEGKLRQVGLDKWYESMVLHCSDHIGIFLAELICSCTKSDRWGFSLDLDVFFDWCGNSKQNRQMLVLIPFFLNCNVILAWLCSFLVTLSCHLQCKIKVFFRCDAKILPNSGCSMSENCNQLFRGNFSLIEKSHNFHNIRAENMINLPLRETTFSDDSFEDSHKFLEFLIPWVYLYLIALAVIRAVSHLNKLKIK